MPLTTAYWKSCEVCGKEFKTVPSSSKQFCCSRECSNKRRTKTRMKYICLICGKDIYALKLKSGGRKYCSTKCKIRALAILKKKRWKSKRIFGNFRDRKELKKYLLEKYNSCQKCGWKEEHAVLEIHHKDRNRKNNKENNVLLLCPNCHSIEHYKKKDGQFQSNLGLKKGA